MSGVAATLGALVYAASGARALWFGVGGVMLVLTAWAARLTRQAVAWQVAERPEAISADPSPA
jgi:hypothetical protein